MNPWYWNYHEPTRDRVDQSHNAEMRRENRNRLRETTFAGRTYFHCSVCDAGFLRRINAVTHCRHKANT